MADLRRAPDLAVERSRYEVPDPWPLCPDCGGVARVEWCETTMCGSHVRTFIPSRAICDRCSAPPLRPELVQRG